MPTTKEIQGALAKLGYLSPLGVDGDFGRNTITAIAEFQKERGLDIKYPGTVGPKTLEALGFPAVIVDMATTSPDPIWYQEALRKLGLHESRDKLTLSSYLKKYGGSVGDPTKVPWCGDFVESVIVKTLPHEPVPTNPYWALNWSKFGKSLAIPVRGAIVTFRRYDKKGRLIGGHVGFIAGHDANYFHVLGGNQSNAVTIAKVAKDRMDAMRWPSTVEMPRVAVTKSTFNGTISTNEA